MQIESDRTGYKYALFVTASEVTIAVCLLNLRTKHDMEMKLKSIDFSLGGTRLYKLMPANSL